MDVSGRDHIWYSLRSAHGPERRLYGSYYCVADFLQFLCTNDFLSVAGKESNHCAVVERLDAQLYLSAGGVSPDGSSEVKNACCYSSRQL